MKIAGHTMGAPEYTLPEALELFKSIGLDGAELVVQDDYKPGIPTAATQREIAAIRSKADSLGLEIPCLTPYYSEFNNLDDAVRNADMDGMKRVIDYASRLGAKYIRVYAGNYPNGDSDPDGRKRARLIDALRQLGDIARDAGVMMVAENHFNTMTVSAVQTAAVVTEVAHPAVGILYDQVNLAFTYQEEYPEAIALQKSHIAYVHVKDLVFTTTDKVFTSGNICRQSADERKVASRIVGEGVMDWPSILRTLTDIGYDGWLSLEYERRWHPQDIPDASIGMKKSCDYLKRILGTEPGASS